MRQQAGTDNDLQPDYSDMLIVSSGKELNKFVLDMIGYMPGWLRTVYRIRGAFASLLGLEHDNSLSCGPVANDRSSLYPGGNVRFFNSISYEQGIQWIGEVPDKHLDAWLSVELSKSTEGQNEFRVITTVKFKNYRGRFYFGVIKPAHRFIVRKMAEYAAEN